MRVRTGCAWFAASMLLPSIALAQSGLFRSAYTEITNGRPTALTLGDFNGDGAPDVACSTQEGSVALLGNFADGSGEIFFDTSIATGNFPAGLITGKFDADDIPDMVVSNGSGNEIAFLKGLGNNDYFEPPSSRAAVGQDPRGLASADLDGDGELDLVVANRGPETAPGSVSILRGQGDGSFTLVFQPTDDPMDEDGLVEELPAGLDTRAVAIGEVSGDQTLDILALNTGSGTVTVYRGLGNATFEMLGTVELDAPAEAMALADMNGDQILDLLTADGVDDHVSLRLGAGDGTFGERKAYLAGSVPNGIAVRDIDGDGHTDVLVSNGRSSDLTVLFGDGDGNLDRSRSFVGQADMLGIATTDMNDDGMPDVVAIADPDAGAVAVLRNLGGGALNSGEDLPAGSTPSAVVSADADDDAVPDLFVAVENGDVLLFRARAGGGFSAPDRIDVGGRPRDLVARDLNGDGHVDLAVADADNGQVLVLRGLGGGRFGPAATYPISGQIAAMSEGDFNADGRSDLALTVTGSPGHVMTLLQQSDGTYGGAISSTVEETPIGLDSSDLNGDGRDDLIVANSASNTVSVLRSNGDGSFTPSQTIPLGPQNPLSIAIGDFDRDGNADFAVGFTIAGPGQPSVSMYVGHGDGTFEAKSSGNVGLLIQSIVARDIDGDGLVDLAMVSGNANVVRVLRGNGEGFFSGGQGDTVSRMPISIAAADFDDDGRYDVATANNDVNSSNASVLTNCVNLGSCRRVNGAVLPIRGDGNDDGIASAADLIAVAKEVGDGDGTAIEQINLPGASGYAASLGVDANGDGRVDAQDRIAVARRIFAGV